MAAQFVAASDAVACTCADCQGYALMAEVHAVGELGTVRVMWLWECDRCGDFAVCAFCAERVDHDGADMWRHVARVHADG